MKQVPLEQITSCVIVQNNYMSLGSYAREEFGIGVKHPIYCFLFFILVRRICARYNIVSPDLYQKYQILFIIFIYFGSLCPYAICLDVYLISQLNFSFSFEISRDAVFVFGILMFWIHTKALHIINQSFQNIIL